MTPLFTNEQIAQLIPQRPPIVMIDTVLRADENGICTALTVKEDNLFLWDGHLQEAGLVEHMAQTAAALAGVGNIISHAAPKVGFIGEVKDFTCFTLPKLGQTITTTLTTIADLAGVRLVACKTECNGQPVAQGQLKIVIQD